jgi:hypothetical protein
VLALGLTLVLSVLLHSLWEVSAQEELGSLHVTKKARVVTDQKWVITALTITNNSSVPVFDVEVFEYFNTNFTLAGNATWRFRDEVFLTPLGRPVLGQFIISFHRALGPGDTLTLEYASLAPRSGDFRILPSLVWFSHFYGLSELRSNIYSNGLLVRIPSSLELAVTGGIPYIISVASGVVTFFALYNLRKHLRKTPPGR